MKPTPARSRPIAIDLFCGAGGMSLGLEQAGFDVALAVDRDPHHIATYKRNFPQFKSWQADISKLSGSRIRELVGRTDLDLVCGGPPCQGFSAIGKRQATDPRNVLVHHFVRLVAELRPKAFILENVPGLGTGPMKSTVAAATREFSRRGYLVTAPVENLDASGFGVPQRRERLFIMGIRREYGAAIPYPCQRLGGGSDTPTVWEAIGDLPRLAGREDLFISDSAQYPPLHPQSLHPYAELARGRRRDDKDVSYPRVWDDTECSGCSRVRHRREVVRLYSATAPGAMVPSHHLPRLRPDGLCPTLRAGTDSDHGSFNAPRPVHPFEPRCITVREAARLHGYPDWFRFFPAKWHAHRQIGNSVCPPVARAVGFAVIEALSLPCPTRPTEALALGATFDLPKSGRRPRSRITQLAEWPKVVMHLFEKAGRAKSGSLRRPTFSIGDVGRAYQATDARMPRTPPGRFLVDIARSRNRKAILGPLRREGYSILKVGQNGQYGRFVPVGTPGTLDSGNSLSIRRSEIRKVRNIAVSESVTLSAVQILGVLARPSVGRSLFGNDAQISVVEESPDVRRRRVVWGEVAARSGRARAIILLASHRDMPELQAIGELLIKTGTRVAIVVAAATREHLIAVVVSRRGKCLSVRRRLVFRLSQRRRAAATSKLRSPK